MFKRNKEEEKEDHDYCTDHKKNLKPLKTKRHS